MELYIANRQGTVLVTCSDNLPNNKTLLADKLTDELGAGCKIFECTLRATPEIKAAAIAGNSLMVSGIPFTIITSQYTYTQNTMELYCEDAGLDFINKIVPPAKSNTLSNIDWIIDTLGTEEESGWHYNFNIDEEVKELEYTVDSTALERLLNILDNFDAEMYFSYEFVGLNAITKTINFIKERGDKNKPHTVYIDREVVSITEKSSVEELATVWQLYGKNGVSLEKLTGYSTAQKEYPIEEGKRKHSYSVVGNELICNEGLVKWASTLNPSGRIVQAKSTEYTEAAKLISYAVGEMEKIVDTVMTYEVELQRLPEGINAGDYMNILDDKEMILVNARIKTWSISQLSHTVEVELSDFVQLQSGIVRRQNPNFSIYTLSITSTKGTVGMQSLSTVLNVSIYFNGRTITSYEELPIGHLVWYIDNVLVPEDDTRISNNGFTFTTGQILQSHTYRCELVE